ncbi:MAG: DNA polymerase III subunit delta' [Anaerolineales bacterium]|nr:DNA polymerase III subunit delta' [Anaerolineales bacterium]
MDWNMIGHRWAIGLLGKHLRSGALRHAYLFSGPQGVGKRTLATRLASAIFCEREDDHPCGVCRACGHVSELRHPDLHVVQAEEGETTLKVHQIRDMQRRISLAPYEADRRVVLLLRTHQMSVEAGNALLKTLEEPPADSVLLLTAESRESLLPTIVSRCEVLALRPVANDVLVRALRERLEQPERAESLAGLAAGRPGVALKLATDDDELERRKEHVAELVRLLQSDRRHRFSYADDLTPRKDASAERARAQEILETWLAVLRALMLRVHGAGAGAANQSLADIGALAQAVTPRQAAEATRGIERALVGLQLNANLQLTLETALLKLPYVRLEGEGVRPAG